MTIAESYAKSFFAACDHNRKLHMRLHPPAGYVFCNHCQDWRSIDGHRFYNPPTRKDPMTMTKQEKFVQLANVLLKKTIDNSVKWEPMAQEHQYLSVVPNQSFEIKWRTFTGAYVLSLRDDSGSVVSEHITSNAGEAAAFKPLYSAITDQLGSYTLLIDNYLEALKH